MRQEVNRATNHDPSAGAQLPLLAVMVVYTVSGLLLRFSA